MKLRASKVISNSFSNKESNSLNFPQKKDFSLGLIGIFSKKKSLNLKILKFIFALFRTLNKKISGKRIWYQSPFGNRKDLKVYKTCQFLIKKSYRIFSILKGFEPNLKVQWRNFYLFFKFGLYSTLFRKGFSAGFKAFYISLLSNYFLYSVYSSLKDFLNFIYLNTGKYSPAKQNFFLENSLVEIDSGAVEQSLNFYETTVYKSSIFSKTGQNSSFRSKELPFRVLKRLSKNVMSSKKIPLDDKRLSQIYTIIRSFLKKKGLKHPDVSKMLVKSVNIIKPLYKIVYQRRGRNKIGVAKYLFVNNIRDSIAIKNITWATKYLRIRSPYSKNLEYKVAISLIDTLTKQGYAYSSFIESTSRSFKGRRLLNKGYLLKSVKPLLAK